MTHTAETFFELHQGDCLDVLRQLQDCSVDAVVTDPPYGLSFMGKRWDYDVPSTEVWAECLRVLKPGGHLLAFAGTRTQHRMAVRIEDAGFEIRDMIAWVYGSGFPKSLDVSKAIDKAAGAEREVVGLRHSHRPNRVGGKGQSMSGVYTEALETTPATDAARQWQGWGTALKPALEPITVARKPLAGTVAANVLKHGTGAINVDACRVGVDRITGTRGAGGQNGKYSPIGAGSYDHVGRWPANLIHDGGDEPVDLLGEAARFFYCAKASKRDRDEGLEGFEVQRTGGMQATADGSMLTGGGNQRTTVRANIHPTVKPTDLMRYLCRLVTPLGGIVLDPFMGSGSTGKAAMLEGFGFIGIERDPEYINIARARISAAHLDEQIREYEAQTSLFG
jgi:site-specific DNA-methyltransferase (adenine-specific)